jgi:hypothetical protein
MRQKRGLSLQVSTISDIFSVVLLLGKLRLGAHKEFRGACELPSLVGWGTACQSQGTVWVGR